MPERLSGGDYASWALSMDAALAGTATTDVPCGTCTGCCTSSQFIGIGPNETVTLRRIPRELLFPAPLAPPGHVVMGYNEHGHCPMLVDMACSIYADRPQTCRTYDCRIFAGVGITLDAQHDPDKTAIAASANRWEFSYPSEIDRLQHQAARDAEHFLRTAPELHDLVPRTTTQRAVLAFRMRDLFLDATNCTTPAQRVAEIRRRLTA